MVRGRTRAFLAGPPLLKAATGEIATEEELGGAEMHTIVSGLGDYLAEDDRDALRIAREIMAQLEWDRPEPAQPQFKPPRYDAGRAARHHADGPQAPGRHARRRSRASSTIPISPSSAPNYGPATVCGHARIEGQAIGIITNNGPLDPARRQQGDAFHPGLLPVAHAAALSEQHHRLHGRQGL